MTTVNPKDPDVNATYTIDAWEALVTPALRSYAFAANDVVRAHRDTGFYYVASKAGRTAEHYPDWPSTAAETVNDGSVIWTTTDPASAGPPTISSVVWMVPTGVTLVSQSEGDHTLSITLSGGVAGQSYEVTARVTPNSGNPRDFTITVPVENL